MANEKVTIDLCSSDEDEKDVFGDENDYVHDGETEEEYDEEGEEDEDEDEEDTNSSGDDSDWIPDDVETDQIGGKGDDDSDDKVTRLLRAGSELKSLNVKDCKAYLRKHGLRLSGTKAVCIHRILEHWRIKDGSGEAVYPRSSFVINCKGDVCKGDVVCFTQKVLQKNENMKKSGKIMGRRTVAGQVIKESYGTAKQQHTFTIEVLWCQGTQKLPPLYPLLVKGRNLYRLMTLRQRWANEEDRVKVLSEKHNRGAAARKIMRERKIKSGYVVKDGRLQKPDHMKKPCQVKRKKNEKDENLTQRFRQDIPAKHSLVAPPNKNPSQGHKNQTELRNMNPPNSSISHPYAPRPHAPLTYAPRSYAPFHVPHSHLAGPKIPPCNFYTDPTQQNQTNQRPPPAFYNGRPASNALQQGQASFNPHAMPVTHQRRPYQNHHTHHGSSNSGYNLGMNDLAHFANMMISHRTEGRYRQSEASRGPSKNHNTFHSNSNSGYNYGARNLYTESQRSDGDNHAKYPGSHFSGYRKET